MKGWFLSASHVCACVILLVACGGEEAAETGSNVVDACADLAAGDLCPAGTTIDFDAAAIADCGGSAGGTVGLTDGSGEISARCGSQGDCSFLCVPPAACCGGEEWTDTSYKCDLPCAGVDTCSCEDRCGAIQDGDCVVDCGSCPVGSVCSDAGVCEAGCAEGAALCAGSCCGAGEVCYLNLCCDRVTNCTGKECGNDKCGGDCDEQESIPGCVQNETCENGTCSQTCFLGDQQCLISGGQAKIQTCELNDELLGWYVTDYCQDDTPNCLLTPTGATCVPCSDNKDCVGDQTCDEEGLCTGECPPQCEGLECGSDQCGGVCGDCVESKGVDWACDDGTGLCIDTTTCVPDCENKACGDDGCAGNCGDCSENEDCDPDGLCCSTDCGNKQCGTNECGGSCGECDDGDACSDAFTCECVTTCGEAVCGDDGCEGVCGDCVSAKPECVNGECKCIPSCVDKDCGDDGCDGSCPDLCEADQGCNQSTGVCADTCAPACAGKKCGGDGCGVGGTCGECIAPKECDSGGLCNLPCEPECAGKNCGPNGCGGSCGSCEGTAECSPDDVCVDPPPPCGSVNLTEEGPGGVYLRMDVDYNEESTPHTNYALGVWVQAKNGDAVNGERTVLESQTGLMVSFKTYNSGQNADFVGGFPNTKEPTEPYTFTKTGLSGYSDWWNSPPASGPQWVLMGFVKQGDKVYWCASNTASDIPIKVMYGVDTPDMYLDQLVGDGTTDNSGEATRIGQQADSIGNSLLAYVGGVRIYVIEDAAEVIVTTAACKLLWYAMEDEPNAFASSGWTALRSWSLNTLGPSGDFIEDNENGQSLQLMDEWDPDQNFEPDHCPVAY